jgi:hypothetical protein
VAAALRRSSSWASLTEGLGARVYDASMDRGSRREHLEGLLEELREQRKVDIDQVLMELVHFVFELDDDVRSLNAKISQLEHRR